MSRGPKQPGGVVAAGHPATAAAAVTILEEGGNAFDAALAAMAAAAVSEPVLSSLGGGGFLLAKPADGVPRLYDFFAQTPSSRPEENDRDFHPVVCDFGEAQQQFHIGMASIATPGVVRGLFEISRDLGRMPIGAVVAPAVELARDGAPLNDLQAYIFKVVGAIYMSTPASRAIFESPERPGELLGAGERIVNADYAAVLENLAIEGEDLFYRGEIGARIAEDCRAGGALTRRDLARYEIKRRRPLEAEYRGARLFTNPPPSTGGLLMSFALTLLGDDGFGDAVFGSAGHLGRLLRVIDLTNEARLESRLHEINAAEAADALFHPAFVETYRRYLQGRPRAPRGTTHISVIDGHGNAAAMTLSNGEGSGYIAPDTGIMLNNMLGEEDINPHGFHAWPCDVRLASMMAPTLLIEPSGRLTAMGSGGSNRIRTALLQVLNNLLDFGMALAPAIESPRLHFERQRLDIEPGFAPEVVAPLFEAHRDHKLWDRQNLFFGGVHAVRVDAASDEVSGVGDPRRGGVSVRI